MHNKQHDNSRENAAKQNISPKAPDTAGDLLNKAIPVISQAYTLKVGFFGRTVQKEVSKKAIVPATTRAE